jgi:periplasmic divalent cation tolerance protein
MSDSDAMPIAATGPTSSAARIIITSCPDDSHAATLARTLVEEKLAACVTRLAGARSIYRWEGKIEETTEVVCLIKTTADRVDALYVRLRELHPYEVPEGLTLTVESGLPSYLAWLTAETR